MSDSCVYIRDAENGWLPANVVSQDGLDVTVKAFSADGKDPLGERTVSIKDYPDQQLPLQNVDASGNLMEMPDMVDLPSLHEAAILYNLKVRHQADKPYTRVGELIIAVNPFKWLEKLYSDDNREKYVSELIYKSSTSGVDMRAGLDPHVYETSCMAYRGLAVDGKHQSILVSGESGAGKTETVKIVMRHLSSVTSGAGEKSSRVVQRVLDGQPLLEAFGNAKTVRNDNSSRFGKFIQMEFDVEDATQAAFSGRAIPNCVLAGSVCETYLLEKSRVVSHEEGERGYHIFYQVLAASDDAKQKYMPHLSKKVQSDFRYIGNTEPVKIDGLFDDERFNVTLDALKLLDMSEDKLKTLFKAITCVMQLGNITFAEDPDDSEKSVVSSADELVTLSEWIGVPKDKVERSLTYRTIVAGKEQYEVPLKVNDARDGCDAFAKEIYQQIFEWLVREINQMTCAENNYDDAEQVEEYGLIALLDIFGFESFEVNRFEQLCINYTNEKLQQKYTVDIFRSVQEEYTQEGIELGNIQFADNVEVLRLIEGKIGIISVLNEECVRPKGNDISFVSKVKEINKEVSALVSEKLHKPTEFAIEHYAGVVKYDSTMFVQKNTDTLPKDMIDCACLSSNEIIKVELKAAAEAKVVTGTAGRGRTSTITVATKFKLQLTSLMNDITQTKTRYIRCIKPNPQKVPNEMDMFSSSEQLRCAGVVAAVTISRVAFPNRLTHETALERFSCLSHVTLDSLVEKRKESSENDLSGYKEIVEGIFDGLLKEQEKKNEEKVIKAFECGSSRVYFRLGALESLEAKRLIALGVFATAIERIVRGFTARSLYWKLVNASIASQANARRTVGRKKFLRAKQNAINIECWVRCVYAKRELKRLVRKKAATKIQSRWRSVMAVASLAKSKNAAVLIQKVTRGALQRPKYRVALKEAAEEARVNSKLAALQKRLQEAELKFFQADKLRIEAEKRAAGQPGDEAAPPLVPAEAEAAPGQSAPEQPQALIDESNEMLDYFRKEVFKLKSANYLLRTDLQTQQDENRELQSRVEGTEASYTAMRHNIAKLSQSNMRLAVELGEEKSFILKLKKDIKMDRIRHNAELQRKSEEVLGRDKVHQMEVKKLTGDISRLRAICVENGVEVPEHFDEKKPKTAPSLKFERATFHNKDSLLRSLEIHNKGDGTSLSKASFASGDPSLTQVQDDDSNTWRKPRHHFRAPLGAYQGRGRHYHRGGFFAGGRGRYHHPGRYHHSQKPPTSLNKDISLNKNTGTSLGAAARTTPPPVTGGSSLASASASGPKLSGSKGGTSLAAAATGGVSGSSLSRARAGKK